MTAIILQFPRLGRELNAAQRALAERKQLARRVRGLPPDYSPPRTKMGDATKALFILGLGFIVTVVLTRRTA